MLDKNISELTSDLFSIFLPMDIKYKERLNMFLLEYKDLIKKEIANEIANNTLNLRRNK
jgi:hypothetical protein